MVVLVILGKVEDNNSYKDSSKHNFMDHIGAVNRFSGAYGIINRIIVDGTAEARRSIGRTRIPEGMTDHVGFESAYAELEEALKTLDDKRQRCTDLLTYMKRDINKAEDMAEGRPERG